MLTKESQEQLLSNLAADARAGKEKSYHELLAKLEIIAKRYLAKHLFIKEDMQDIVQEILMSTHKALHTYQTEKPFLPWFFSIVRFRLTDYLRKHYTKQKFTFSIVDADDILLSSNDDSEESKRETHEIVHAYLSQLPERQQKIIKMVFLAEMSGEDVAAAMNITITNVRVSTYRSVKKLKELVKSDKSK